MSRTLKIGDPIISSDDFRIGMVISSGQGLGGRTYKIVKRYPRATEYGSVWGWVELRKNGTWPKGPKRINGAWLSQHFPRHGYDVIADPTLAMETLVRAPLGSLAGERRPRRPGGGRPATQSERLCLRAGIRFDKVDDGRGGVTLNINELARLVSALGGE